MRGADGDRAHDRPDEGRITIGRRGGRKGPGDRRAALRALAAVLALGLGAGGGAVVGLWAAVSWWASRADGATTPGGLLVAVPVGVLLGAVLGIAVAGAAVAVAAAVRGRRRPDGPDDGARPVRADDQSRSS